MMLYNTGYNIINMRKNFYFLYVSTILYVNAFSVKQNTPKVAYFYRKNFV